MEKINHRNEFFIILTVIIIAEIITWYSLKKRYLERDNFYLFVYYGMFLTIATLLLLTAKYESIAITNIMWNIASTILVLMLGYFIFKEHITRYQYIGICLGLLSIVFLTINK
jgi:multidrug transporter EmrE-like cation transporter